MKVLFLDDSYQKNSKLLGYGGFCVAGEKLRALSDSLADLKRDYRIPLKVELKWSRPPNHYLSKNFKGSFSSLTHDAIAILRKYDCKVLAAAHSLKECYGVKIHGWPIPQAIKWATKKQLGYLSERFDNNLLDPATDQGIIIIDNMPSRESESALIGSYSIDMMFGSEYSSFDRIALVPMLADSKHCTQIQLADLVIGILISAVSGSTYALQFLDDLAPIFIHDPGKKCTNYWSTWTSAVLGYGFVLFPQSLKKSAQSVFAQVDM